MPKDVEALLAHAGWIRSLARQLASDPNRADDLVQQTWVAALEHRVVVAVPETRRTVVFRIHDHELLRVPVRLVPGEIVTVGP